MDEKAHTVSWKEYRMKRLILVGGLVVLGLIGILRAENCYYECAQITACEGMDKECP